MSAEGTTPCAAGCVVRGQHVTDHDAVDLCKGCRPRLAVYGLLCAFCWQRLSSDVATAPSLVRHLRGVAVPDAGAKPSSDDRGYRDPSEGSVLSGAVSDADDLHALLATFAVMYVDDHPGAVGPDERHTWRTQQTVRGNEYGTWVKRPTVAGIRHPDATVDLVRWLLPQLEWMSRQGWVGEARTELGQMTAQIKARWPMEDTQTRPVPGVPCPRCDRLQLTYSPPSWFKAPFVTACQNPECGRTFSEDEWDRLVGLTTGHIPTGTGDPAPYVRPPSPLRLPPNVRAAAFRGLTVDDDAPVAVCPVCHLVQPCEHSPVDAS